jgi:hypothetical protein
MCLDKNYRAIDALREYTPLEPLVRLVSNPLIDYRLRESLFELLGNMWVESLSCQLRLPQLLCNTGLLTLETDIAKYLAFNRLEEYTPLRRFLHQFITTLLGPEGKRRLNIADLRIFVRVLEMIRCFLEYGLFEEGSQVVLIGDMLYRFLNVSQFEGDDLGDTVDIMAESRKLVCRILLFIKQLEVEAKGQYCLYRLKRWDFSPEAEEMLELVREASALRFGSQWPLKSKIVMLASLMVERDRPFLNWSSFELMLKETTEPLLITDHLMQVRLVEEQYMDTYNKIMALRDELTQHCNRTEEWYGRLGQEGVARRVIEILAEFIRILAPSARKLGFEMLTRASISLNFQTNLRVSDIHVEIMKLLQFDIDRFDELEEEELSMSILRMAYLFLALFCHQNPGNQGLLKEQLNIFIHHCAYKYAGLGSHILIKEIVSNNPKLLNDPGLVGRLTELTCGILDKLEDSQKDWAYREELVQLLLCLMEIDGRCIAPNQVIILNAYVSPRYPRIVQGWRAISLTAAPIKAFEASLQQALEGASAADIRSPVQLDLYLLTIRLFEKTTGDVNDITEKKLRFYVKEQDFVQLLTQHSRNLLLCSHLLKYYMEVFLITEDEVSYDSLHTKIELYSLLVRQAHEYLALLARSRLLESMEVASVSFMSFRKSAPDLLLEYLFETIAPLLEKLVRFCEGIKVASSRPLCECTLALLRDNRVQFKSSAGVFSLLSYMRVVEPVLYSEHQAEIEGFKARLLSNDSVVFETNIFKDVEGALPERYSSNLSALAASD